MSLNSKHTNSFLKGFASIYEIYPEVEVPSIQESKVIIPQSDYNSLQSDWVKIGHDIGKAISYGNTTE